MHSQRTYREMLEESGEGRERANVEKEEEEDENKNINSMLKERLAGRRRMLSSEQQQL